MSKLGQLLMIGIGGTKVTPELSRFIRESNVGGVILFRRNCKKLSQILDLIKAIQDAADAPLIIGVDQEGGRVLRLPKPFTQIPPMASVGEEDDSGELAREIGVLLGKELSAVGINLNFAPVLDVATNAFSPAIGDRSFSSDAGKVARLGAEFIRGIESQGVAACGKHFPGHGDTDVDSHLGLPVLSHTKKRFEVCEFIPFKAAVAARVSSMMTAHILVPNLDRSNPASISRTVITEILRKEIGFDGLVFSDDLMMKGIADIHPPHESIWRAVAAGTDIAMICCDDIGIQRRALDSLKKAADDGRVGDRKIAESLARIELFKKRFCRFDRESQNEPASL